MGLGQTTSAGSTPVVIASDQSALRTDAAIPVSTDIVSGRLALAATTAATTLVTIPAGRTWQGTIGASVSVNNAAATTTAGQASAKFSVAGTGVKPAAGIYFAVDTQVGAALATSVLGEQSSNFGSAQMFVTAPAGNSVTIQVASTNSGTSALVDAFAIGILL